MYATGFLDFPVSLVAAGVLVSARRAAGAWPFWPAALALLTGASPAQRSLVVATMWAVLGSSTCLSCEFGLLLTGVKRPANGLGFKR